MTTYDFKSRAELLAAAKEVVADGCGCDRQCELPGPDVRCSCENDARQIIDMAQAGLLAAAIEVRRCGNGGAKLSRKASDMIRAAIAQAQGD